MSTKPSCARVLKIRCIGKNSVKIEIVTDRVPMENGAPKPRKKCDVCPLPRHRMDVTILNTFLRPIITLASV